MNIPDITDEEMRLLESSHNSDEWNMTCDIIKKARNGHYPSDWYAKVIVSGFYSKVAGGWL